jgi:hypothetical protein
MNDIEMFQDIEEHKLNNEIEEYNLLIKCYHYRFIEFNKNKSEKFKKEYIKKFKYWGNYF